MHPPRRRQLLGKTSRRRRPLRLVREPTWCSREILFRRSRRSFTRTARAGRKSATRIFKERRARRKSPPARSWPFPSSTGSVGLPHVARQNVELVAVLGNRAPRDRDAAFAENFHDLLVAQRIFRIFAFDEVG